MNWKDGTIYWSTRSSTFMMAVRDGRVVGCPEFAKKWALGRKVEDIVWRAEQRGVVLHWQGPLDQEEEDGDVA